MGNLYGDVSECRMTARLNIRIDETIGGEYFCMHGRRPWDEVEITVIVPTGQGHHVVQAIAEGRFRLVILKHPRKELRHG